MLFAFATPLTLTPLALPLALPFALTAAGSALLAFAVLLLLLLLFWLIILTIDVVVLVTGVVAARGISAGGAGVGPGTLAATVEVGGRTSNVGLHMASAGLVCRPTFLGHMATMLAPIGPGEGIRREMLDDLVD